MFFSMRISRLPAFCLLALAALGGLFPAAGLAGAEDPQAMHLLCWSEYVPQTVIAGFTRKTGVKVEIENYNSNEQMLEKLRSRPGFYDLIQPSGFYVASLAQDGKLEPLDAARIPNLKNLDAKYRHPAHDPEGRFSVPWLVGTVGIVVNTVRVRDPVQTWADVFAGRYAGRIVVVDDPREMVAWALASLGLPITDVSDGALQRAAPVLEKWLPQVKVYDSDSPSSALLDGRADLGIMWSGEAALLWQKDRKFQYILPAAGAHMFIDSLAIPKGAPHKELAEQFIDHCLDPEVSVLISNAYPYTNPNSAARRLLSASQLANPASYPPGDPSLPTLRNTGNTTPAVAAFVARLRKQ
jgi:spermidine/putrescine transport system permease protein